MIYKQDYNIFLYNETINTFPLIKLIMRLKQHSLMLPYSRIHLHQVSYYYALQQAFIFFNYALQLMTYSTFPLSILDIGPHLICFV